MFLFVCLRMYTRAQYHQKNCSMAQTLQKHPTILQVCTLHHVKKITSSTSRFLIISLDGHQDYCPCRKPIVLFFPCQDTTNKIYLNVKPSWNFKVV